MYGKISIEVIATKILEIRNSKVMLDRNLAKLYGVSTKTLNQAVKRNIKRFPTDFMYQLTWQEVKKLKSKITNLNSRSQIVTLKRRDKT